MKANSGWFSIFVRGLKITHSKTCTNVPECYIVRSREQELAPTAVHIIVPSAV
jgi:hypothetical protein